ncbi:hypothetical protein F5Y07DRAFT_191813 [Xylaria sp. FL0933]|nr:hypothetical protein F5Y07DRAFT_191813 [Xylaria sp. FL0933]
MTLLPLALAVKAIPTASHRLGSRRLLVQSVDFRRSIGSTTSSVVEASRPPRVPLSQLRPSRPSSRDPKSRRRRRLVPRLCPVNAYKVTPYKLVKTYTQKLSRGYPMLIRNLPGFLGGQTWIDHVTDREGSFKAPPAHLKQDSVLGFGLLKTIFESATTGRIQRNLNASSQPTNLRAVFDDLVAECKIARACFEGDCPPLLKFRDWLPQSNFRDYSLDKTIVELQEIFRTQPQLWIPFRAPLAFIRAVHQYNRDLKIVTNTAPSSNESPVPGPDDPASIAGLYGLVVLKETMTEEFPFPRIIRDIGLSTYQTRSCSIRAGVRPLRNDIRRYKRSTVVIGQLAGYSVVTLIPPRLKSLDGLSLEFHDRVPKTWDRHTMRFPLGSPGFALPGKTWTRDFEQELVASGDILVATLIPGDGLLVPEGWYYGVRSINNGLQLHATVTWFLSRDDITVGEREEYDRSTYLRKYPPWVAI